MIASRSLLPGGLRPRGQTGTMKYTVILSAILLLGCRSVWVHPEATAQKYEGDLFFCKHGVERSEWKPDPGEVATDSDREWALGGGSQPTVVREGWKHCMIRLGWHTVVGGRSEKPWRTPAERRKRYGKR